MPRLRTPESDEAKSSFMLKAITTAAVDAAKGNEYVAPKVITAAGRFAPDRQENGATVPGFASLASQRQLAEGRVAKENGESQVAEVVLEDYIRDYIVVLGRRTFREKHSVAVLDCHGLNHSAEMPVFNSRDERWALAKQLIDGDAAAKAMGFPEMTNPSAAELKQKRDDAVREFGEITPVDRDLQALIEKIRAARPQANKLVDDLIAELRHNTRDLEPGTARDVMRSYGLSFEYLQGETPDAGQPQNSPAAGGGTAPAPAPTSAPQR